MAWWHLCVLAAIALPSSCFGSDIYVATDGKDSNDGRSAKTPFLTLQKARDSAKSGDAVHVASGSYQLKEPLSMGSAQSGIRWLASGSPGSARISGGVEIGPWKALLSTGECAADYGKNAPCCGQSGGAVDSRFVCPADKPRCVNYVYNEHFGQCTAAQQCAADHGKSTPCCGQPGDLVDPKYICPADASVCVDYVYNHHYGHCSAPLKIVTADVSHLGKDAQDRHLYVNGIRARRTRLAESTAQAAFAHAHMTDDGFTGAVPDALRAGMEFVFPQSTSPWTEPRCAVASVNATLVAMQQPCWHNLVHKACGQTVKGAPIGGRGYVENAGVSSIAAPGDWALEDGIVHYALRTDESISSISAIMPVLETLVDVNTNDVHFEGFAFEHATWLRPGQGDGYVEVQTGACAIGFNFTANSNCGKDDSHYSVKSAGNIRVANASRVTFAQCEFTRLGGFGLDFTDTRDCLVDSCYFHDISGSAVQIGQFVDPKSTADVGNIVRNTIVNKPGAEFSGAAGINVGYTQGTILTGNDVSNMTYGAISVGWGWSRHENWYETNAANNTIAFNRVHDYKQTLNDGGGIYMLGPQNGSLIHDNWVYNQGTASSGALYPDEGSAYSQWYNNVVTNIGRSKWLHLWTSSIHNVIVRNNFADTSRYLNHGTNCPMINNTVFTPGQPPPAAVAIMNASGVKKNNPFLGVSEDLPALVLYV